MKKKEEVKEMKPCDVCKGTGHNPNDEDKSCPKCNGTGKI